MSRSELNVPRGLNRPMLGSHDGAHEADRSGFPLNHAVINVGKALSRIKEVGYRLRISGVLEERHLPTIEDRRSGYGPIATVI